MENLTRQSADNTPDTTRQLPDSRPDSNICPADSLADDRQNSDIFSKISILELQKKYGIRRDSLYSRMRYLQITTYKVKGKAYLDAGQVTQMDALHDHIQTTGKMEGFPIPESSGPVEVEDEQPASITTLAVTTQTQHIAAPNYAPQETRSQTSEQVDDVIALIRSAQGKAAGVMIAENLLARQYIQNPELLPDDLRQKIKESGEMPTIDPFAYAQSLVGLAKLAS